MTQNRGVGGGLPPVTLDKWWLITDEWIAIWDWISLHLSQNKLNQVNLKMSPSFQLKSPALITSYFYLHLLLLCLWYTLFSHSPLLSPLLLTFPVLPSSSPSLSPLISWGLGYCLATESDVVLSHPALKSWSLPSDSKTWIMSLLDCCGISLSLSPPCYISMKVRWVDEERRRGKEQWVEDQ